VRTTPLPLLRKSRGHGDATAAMACRDATTLLGPHPLYTQWTSHLTPTRPLQPRGLRVRRLAIVCTLRPVCQHRPGIGQRVHVLCEWGVAAEDMLALVPREGHQNWKG
jgi:hypothetical protein